MNDLTMIRGDDQTFSVTLVDPSDLPFDLTGCDLWFTVGEDFTKTIGAGIVIDPDGSPAPDPTTGIAAVTIASADTEGFPDHRTVREYAVRVGLADGTIQTPLRGRFIVLPVPQPVT